MNEVEKLKLLAKDYSILYAEDNDSLRQKAGKFLRNFFTDVYLASDGEEALKLFKNHTPYLIITDIKMPIMDGLELSKHIHSSRSECKIIVMSAFDSNENLFKSIKSGVFRFLKKPASSTELITSLLEAIKELKKQEEKELFLTQLKDIFNYQSSIVILIKDKEIKLVSDRFLEFFDVENIEEFFRKYKNLHNLFLPHEGFLYNDTYRDALDIILKSPDKLFHIKLKDANDELHHFILKLHYIPQKEGYGIISFDDITELNLLGIFDSKSTKKDEFKKEQKAIYDLLDVIKRNNSNIELHNYYHGLSIVHDGIIFEINDKVVTLKSFLTQQKAVLYEKRTIIFSEALPKPILCKKVISNDFDKQKMVFKDLEFLETSPLQRNFIRLEPDSNHTVTLFVNGHKFLSDLYIKDISMEGIKIFSPIDINIHEHDNIRIDMILSIEKQKVIINIEVSFFKSVQKEKGFEIVFLMMLDKTSKQILSDYILKRQVQLIREFKGFEYA